MEVSSTTRRSQSSGLSSFLRKPPVLGLISRTMNRLCLVSEFRREGIGRLKADAPDVGAGEFVGIFRNHLDRIGAIGLVDPHRARCADPIGMQEDHDFAPPPS